MKSLWFKFGYDLFTGFKMQVLKVGINCFFSCFTKWNWRPLSLKSCHFEARKDIITKFESQALHIIRIKYWKTSKSSNPPALRKIAIAWLKTFLYFFAHECMYGGSKHSSNTVLCLLRNLMHHTLDSLE